MTFNWLKSLINRFNNFNRAIRTFVFFVLNFPKGWSYGAVQSTSDNTELLLNSSN